jgi:F-type H+-transporting ATPase subunit delta
MRGSKGATRYAQALIELAVEKNILDTVAVDMQLFQQVCKENREFELMLASPIVRSDKKMEVLKAVFGNFQEMSMKFLELIAKNGREAILPDIAMAFEVQLKAFKGIIPITLVSAKKLDDAVKTSILAKVQAYVTGTLEVTEEIDDSLIGGFIVKMDDQMIDASVASQFTELKQRLTK